MEKLTSLSLLFLLMFLLTSLENKCDKLEDGKYKIHFKTKGFDDYELTIHETEFTKTLKDGSKINGNVEWRGECLLIMTDSAAPKKEPLTEKIEEDLGEECIQLLKRNSRTIEFKTSRTANLKIVINEGEISKER